jgi:hypothetical protein
VSRILTSQIRDSGFANPILKDSNRGFVSWPELPKIRPVLTNPHESWRILSTIVRNESLRIPAGGFANPDSRIRTLKIRFVDSFRRHVFERFVSWIRFVGLFSKDSFRGFVSWKQKSQITRFVSIRKDSYTNPASLVPYERCKTVSFCPIWTYIIHLCEMLWGLFPSSVLPYCKADLMTQQSTRPHPIGLGINGKHNWFSLEESNAKWKKFTP